MVYVQSVCGEPAGVVLALGVGVATGACEGTGVGTEVAVPVAEATGLAGRDEAGAGTMVAEGEAPAHAAASATNKPRATAKKDLMYSPNRGAALSSVAEYAGTPLSCEADRSPASMHDRSRTFTNEHPSRRLAHPGDRRRIPVPL